MATRGLPMPMVFTANMQRDGDRDGGGGAGDDDDDDDERNASLDCGLLTAHRRSIRDAQDLTNPHAESVQPVVWVARSYHVAQTIFICWLEAS